MELILVAIMAAAVASRGLLAYSDSHPYGGWPLSAGVVGFLLAVASGISAVVYAFMVWGWLASEYKVNIINREYGTSYTREEVFYASDVIETVRQLDRKRYEIRGDIVRDKEKP